MAAWNSEKSGEEGKELTGRLLGIAVGAGLTSSACYNPELTPYILVGGALGGGCSAIGTFVYSHIFPFEGDTARCVFVNSVFGSVGAAIGSASCGCASNIGDNIALGGALTFTGCLLGNIFANDFDDKKTKKVSNFAKRLFSYGLISSALVYGGNYIGARQYDVQKAMFNTTNNIGKIVIKYPLGDKKLFEYEINDGQKIFLPKEEILKLERNKKNREVKSSLEEMANKIK